MLIIQRPAVEPLGEEEDNRQRFAIGPLEPGFGHTLGVSLRRTLFVVDPGRGGHPGPFRRRPARVHNFAGCERGHHRHHLELQGHRPPGRDVRARDAPARFERARAR